MRRGAAVSIIVSVLVITILAVGFAVVCKKRERMIKILQHNLYTMLKDTATIFNTHGIHYSITLGTLLGYYREGKIIRGDDDIDIVIHASVVDKVLKLGDKFKKKGLTLLDCTETFLFKHPTCSNRDGSACKMLRVVRNGHKNLYVDICIVDKVGSFYHFRNIDAKCVPYPQHLIEPIVPIHFMGIQTFAPKNTKEFLEFQYGPDFMTPRSFKGKICTVAGYQQSLVDITPKGNMFWAFWGGDVPSKDMFLQMKTWAKSIRKHTFDPNIIILSNIPQVFDEMKNLATVVTWTPEQLTKNPKLIKYLKKHEKGVGYHFAYVSDVIRWLLLYAFGGNWIDMDDVVIRPLPTTKNQMIVDVRNVGDPPPRWLPALIPGKYKHIGDKSIPFRFYNDVVLNMEKHNAFLGEIVNQIPITDKTHVGQVLPTMIFANHPDRHVGNIHAVSFLDVFFHPHTTELLNRHNTLKQYRRISTPVPQWDDQIDQNTYRIVWDTLIDKYGFSVVKNHNIQHGNEQGKKRTLMGWVLSDENIST